MLWLYGSARLARQQQARVVGYPGGWLEAEAKALAMSWQPLPPNPYAGHLLGVWAHSLKAPLAPGWPKASNHVLGNSFAGWLTERLEAVKFWQ